MLQSGDRVDPVPRIDDLHRIVAQCVDDQVLPFAVPAVMIHASVHARQSDAAPQGDGRNFVRYRLLGQSLARKQYGKAGDNDHAYAYLEHGILPLPLTQSAAFKWCYWSGPQNLSATSP